MRPISVFFRATVQYLHCNVRKSVGITIIFVVFLLLKYLFINDDAFARNSRNLQQFQGIILNSTTVISQSNESSFFMSLSYHEQLTCATHNLLSVGNIAQNLGAKIVTPFLLRSRLYGIPDLISDKEVPDIFYPLHTVYDINQLNVTLNHLSNTYLVDFENFLYNAPREIMMFDFIRKNVAPKELSLNSGSITELVNLMNSYSYNIFDCSEIVFKHQQSLLEKINLMLRISTRRLGVEEFTIIKYICINPAADITTDELKEHIGPEPRTIMLTQWRGCAYRSCNVKAPRKLVSESRNKILYHSTRRQPKDIRLPFNDSIKSTAVNFVNKVIKISNPYISVHIRIEKLQRHDLVINRHTYCCLGLLDNLIKSLKKTHFSQTLTVTDIGEYGSDSCTSTECIQYVRRVHTMLANMGLVHTSYIPKLTGSSESPAFVSLVEMHMLAMGDQLVVVGRGSFKHHIITQFLQSNPARKVYHICTEQGNVLNEFSSLDRKC